MLISAKPKLQKEIYNILNDALTEAFKTTYNLSDSESQINNAAKKEIYSAAEKFAKTAADKAAEPLTNAIYDFVKEIGILATPKALIAPTMGGPVTGIINMAEFKIN